MSANRENDALSSRLREAAGQPHPPKLLVEAADEIDRLHGAIEHALDLIDGASYFFVESTLRAALDPAPSGRCAECGGSGIDPAHEVMPTTCHACSGSGHFGRGSES